MIRKLMGFAAVVAVAASLSAAPVYVNDANALSLRGAIERIENEMKKDAGKVKRLSEGVYNAAREGTHALWEYCHHHEAVCISVAVAIALGPDLIIP
jgi:hypothetical protein